MASSFDARVNTGSSRYSPETVYGTFDSECNHHTTQASMRPSVVASTTSDYRPRGSSISQFEKWHAVTITMLEQKASIQDFPWPRLPTCNKIGCTHPKESVQPCQHAMATFLQCSPNYSREWLRKEQRRWQPDAFGPPVDESVQTNAEEMFKLIGQIESSLNDEEECDFERP